MERLLARETAALIHAVRRSCHDKAVIVAADEREAGRRALLNLGHTFGHAIESGMGYGKWLHGEAVAAGIAMAAAMSVRLGWMKQAECDRIRALLQRAQLPVDPPPEISGARFIELMSVDKKVLNGELRLVLLRGIGEALVTADYPLEVLRQSLAA
jgi:3-dehydroquinate synthase